ncbi:hypothetical protein [Proteiniphilum sp.]|uniref:hypothetical protein n=1 Tax=Proteiniphilum sp. TaxID=1926877 RepID=UPI0033322D93
MDGEEPMNVWDRPSGFIFYPDHVDEGVHKLTIGATFTSGTGSLADMMGLEGYAGELSWNIRVIHNPQDRFEVDYRCGLWLCVWICSIRSKNTTQG